MARSKASKIFGAEVEQEKERGFNLKMGKAQSGFCNLHRTGCRSVMRFMHCTLRESEEAEEIKAKMIGCRHVMTRDFNDWLASN